MTNEKLLKELKEEIQQLRDEVRRSAQPVYVPYYPQPYYPQPYYPRPSYPPTYPWWGSGTLIVGNTPTQYSWTSGNVATNATAVTGTTTTYLPLNAQISNTI